MHSKVGQHAIKKPRRQQLETRWATQTIQPVWHLIAAFQNISESRLQLMKLQAFNLLQKNRHNQKQMAQFANHCAIIIQSNYKGYIQRKYYRKFLPIYRKFRSLLEAVVKGWRIRKIFNLKKIKTDLKKINHTSSKLNQREKRILKRNLVYEIKQYEKKGKWIKQYRQQHFQKNNLKCEIQTINIKKILNKQLPNEQKHKQTQRIPHKSQKQKNNDELKDSSKNSQQQIFYHYNNLEQIPLKASGKYEIPNQSQSSKFQQKKTVRIQRKIKQRKKTDNKDQEQKAKVIEIKKVEKQKDEFSQMQEKSIVSIHLGLEEQSNLQSQKVNFVKSKLNSTKKIINLGKIDRKVDRKGIKVTLRDPQKDQEEVMKNQEDKNLQKLQVESDCCKSEMNEILTIYENTYKNKKNAIMENLQNIRKMKKFSSKKYKK